MVTTANPFSKNLPLDTKYSMEIFGENEKKCQNPQKKEFFFLLV